MGNEIIMNIISKYGKVEGVRLNKYTKRPAVGLLNGTKTFKVNLKNGIPSSLTVGGHTLTFLYAEQRKTCYKCGHEGHLANDKVDEVNIFNEEDFPATQLIGEIHSSKTDVREGEESVKVCQVPATTWFGVEKEEASAQTITQETSTTCEAE
ncbi:putative Zinc knuckle-containing protein 14, partial [Homarus americanus]